MSNSTTIINTFFILFFVMSSFYSTNLKKSQKTLGSSSFDIFNIDKLAKDAESHKKNLARLASDENVKKSLKEDFLRSEHDSKKENVKKNLKDEILKTKDQSSDEKVKQSIKREIQKTQDAANNKKHHKTQHKNHTPQKPKSAKADDDLKREKYELSVLGRSNNTNLNHRQKVNKRNFLKGILGFIQEEMQMDSLLEHTNNQNYDEDSEMRKIKGLINPKTPESEDPEIKKIKARINPHRNNSSKVEDAELKKIKTLIHPKKNVEDAEMKKIKSLINPQIPKKVKVLVKKHKSLEGKAVNASEIQTAVRVENPFDFLKKKIGSLNKKQISQALKKANITQVKSTVQNIIKKLPERKKPAPESVELQTKVRVESPIEILNGIKSKFNKTLIKEAIKKVVNKVVNKAKAERNQTYQVVEQKFNKDDEEAHKLAKLDAQKYNKTAIKEAVHKTENKIQKKINKTKKIVQKLAKIDIHKFNKTDIKEALHKTENKIQQKFNKTEIKSQLKKINRTEIKKSIVKRKLKMNFDHHIEEEISEFKKTPAEIREEETLNNNIKGFAAKSLLSASERLKKEITAELQKESAEDTAEEVKALLKFKIERFSEDFKTAATELKGEISAEILNESDKTEIMDKAKAVKILEYPGNSSIEEKEQTAATLKKIVFKMLKVKSNLENDYAKEVLARAYDKVVDLKNQEIERNNAQKKLGQAIQLDAEEKQRTFESLRDAKDETKTAIEEIAEEKVVIESERKEQAEEIRKALPKKRNLRH